MTTDATTYPSQHPQMSQGESDPPPPRERAEQAAETAKHASAEVAQTAGEKTREVAEETRRQAQDLIGTARERIDGEISNQRQSLVSNLREMAGQLSSMANQNEQAPGFVTDLVSQAGDRTQELARWLDGKQPGDLLDDVRHYARRHPGTFLAGAALAGVLAGRLTRGVAAARAEQSDTQSSGGDTTYPADGARGAANTAVNPADGYATGYPPGTDAGAYPGGYSGGAPGSFAGAAPGTYPGADPGANYYGGGTYQPQTQVMPTQAQQPSGAAGAVPDGYGEAPR
jgi:hypothetical protein